MDLGKNSTITIFLHRNIKCLRRKLNWSQEELAGKVGLNRGNIASYENGTAEPKICNLLKISSLFGVSILDLTQQDLSNETTYVEASNNFQKISKGERELISDFQRRAEEIDQVFNGIHTCHQFKMKSISEMPKDMQVMMLHFEQLHDAASALMRNHQALLEFIKCRVK